MCPSPVLIGLTQWVNLKNILKLNPNSSCAQFSPNNPRTSIKELELNSDQKTKVALFNEWTSETFWNIMQHATRFILHTYHSNMKYLCRMIFKNTNLMKNVANKHRETTYSMLQHIAYTKITKLKQSTGTTQITWKHEWNVKTTLLTSRPTRNRTSQHTDRPKSLRTLNITGDRKIVSCWGYLINVII